VGFLFVLFNHLSDSFFLCEKNQRATNYAHCLLCGANKKSFSIKNPVSLQKQDLIHSRFQDCPSRFAVGIIISI